MVAYAIALPLLNKYYYEGETVKDEASTLAFEMFESIRIVVAFGAEARLGAKHQAILQRGQKLDRKQAPLMGVLMAPMFLAVYATFALSFWFGIKQYMNGRIEGIATIIGKPLSYGPVRLAS